MKRIGTLLMLILFAFVTFAAERTEQQMKQAAMSVLNTHGIGAQGAPLQSSNLKQLKQMSKLAIYGYSDGGFAVISRDDRFEAVIGYSETTYDDTQMPCGFEWWLETANAVMEHTGGQSLSFYRIKAYVNSSVEPLMNTKWGQHAPYNNYCCYIIEGNIYQFVTGCAATAMAQIMKYYEYPEKGSGSHSYSVNYDIGTVEFSSNFEEHYYDWDNMRDSYYNDLGISYDYSFTQANAVALLMSDCGISVDMVYNGNGSGANPMKIAPALKTYFSYDENTKQYDRSSYSKDEWMSMIFEELSNGHPIIYYGTDDSEGGHGFILHGYDSSGNVYVNWGWDGDYDGYYDIDLLNPDTYEFSKSQGMIIVVPGVQQELDNTKCKVKITASGSGCVYAKGDNFGINIEKSTQTIRVDKGSSLTLEITPKSNYQVQSITVNGTDVTSELSSIISTSYYTLTNIAEDLIVNVTFKFKPTILTIVSEGGGSVYYNGSIIRNATKEFYVSNYSSAMLYLYPDEGCQIASFYENGIDRTNIISWLSLGSCSYTTLITGDTEVSVIFKSAEIPKYKLTYKVDGDVYKTIEMEYGATITPEPAPEKEGYTFSGWSEIPETMPAHDVTVTGTFSINKYKLTYAVDGEEYKSYEIEYGASITPEEAPMKEGYTFSGWSEIPATMPAYDVTVTGTFEVNIYKLTYIVDGQEYKSYEVEYGATISPEAEPTKEHCTFSGWSEIPETMPAHDVTVTGTFELHFDVGHVVKTLNFIMGNNPTADDMELYDMNHDGVLNIGDVILIVRNILEHGGSVQPAPNAGELIDFSQYTATQFELKTGNVHVNNIRLVENMQQTHRLMYRQIDAETYAVVIYSQSNELLIPDNDNIIAVETDGDTTEAMAIRNITAATPTGETTSYQGLQVATGIRQVESSESSAVIYDLNGRRLNSSFGQKEGIYIINGKKAVVR